MSTEKRESLLYELQVHKARIAGCQQQIREKVATISALAVNSDFLRGKNCKLKLQVAGLSRRVEDLQARIETQASGVGQSACNKISESLPKNLLGIAVKV